MLLLDLSRIHGVRERIERTWGASAFEAAQDDFGIANDVRLSCEIEKKDDRYRLVGRVAGTLELSCSRCAEPFKWPVDASFDLTYLPQSENAGEGEQEVVEEDLDSAFYADETIDLGQLIREQFYLSLPMKPLCSEDCRGLCPVCGLNRNTGRCSCDTKWHDPRLGPLRGILGGTRPGNH
jgi:uncharacterized protein